MYTPIHISILREHTVSKTFFGLISAGSNSSVEEMLGNQGVTESNMMQYLGIIEQRTSEILQAYATSQQMTQAVETQVPMLVKCVGRQYHIDTWKLFQ